MDSVFRRLKNPALVLLLPCLLHTGLSQAGGIYSWKDSDGNVHFGDRPPVDLQSRQLDVKVNSISTPDNVKNSAREYVSNLGQRKPATPSRKRKVVMYSASWCGVCKRARKYFKEEKVPFREVDIDATASGRKAYEKYGTRSVPVIAVGRKHMRGFSPESFERFYAKAGK